MPGMGEETDVLGLAWGNVLNVRRNLSTQLGVMRSTLPLSNRLDAVIQLGRGEILVQVTGVMDLLDALRNPANAAGVFAFFIFPAVYWAAKSGTWSLDIVVVTQDKQLGGPGLPVGLDGRGRCRGPS